VTQTRIRIAAAIAATGAVLTLTACGSSDDATPARQSTTAPASDMVEVPADPPEFIIRAGERVSGPATIELRVGDTVKFTIISDADDELHIHGYDKTIPLKSGEFATVEFKADIPGKFEIELHETGALVTTLQVNG
jgi:plastocyanin